MLIETRELGRVEVSDRQIYEFVAPILGFEDERNYALISDPRAEPFMWLQSLGIIEIAFPVVDASTLGLAWEQFVGRAELRLLAADSVNELKMLIMAIIPRDVSQMRLNLSAPLLLNSRRHLGAQLVIERQPSLALNEEPRTTASAGV